MRLRPCRLIRISFFIAAIAAPGWAAESTPPAAPVESTAPTQDQAALIDARLEELGERERDLRQKWMTGQRRDMLAKRDLLAKDEDVKALQSRIDALMADIRALNAEMDKLVAERLASAGPANVADEQEESGVLSQTELQREIIQLGNQRRELMRERERLRFQREAAESIDSPANEPMQEGAE